MKAIVTGGLGFIGHNLVKALLNNNWTQWQIMVIDPNVQNKYWDNVEYKIFKLEQHTEDITETVIDKAVQEFKPDVIFHLAAIPRVAYSVEHPYETTQDNILSTLAVLDAVRKYSPTTRVVYSSSSSIYGGATTLPTPVTYPSNPQSPYAMQKWQGEEWCRLYSKLYKLDTVCLRYFNVIGKYSRYGGAYSTVLSAWLYSLYIDPSVKPFLEGDGSVTRDFCSVNNVTQANVLAALYNKCHFQGEAFNVSQGKSYSLLQCKELLEKISGKKLDLEYRPPRKGDVQSTLGDISLTKSILEYHPDINFEEQVKTMADWYKNNYAS